MNKLNALISEIKKEQKLSSDEILSVLSEAICNEEDPSETYKELYLRAFGKKLNEATCKEWVSKLKGGQKWSVEQTYDVGQRVGVDWSCMTKYEFWACMNAFYYDFKRSAEKYELQDENEYFGDIVWDYFNDDDAHDKTPLMYYLAFVA